jgi:hypothetical protein
MIRKDFYDSGFPLCRRAPIICVDDKGDIYPVYNGYDLKLVIDNKKVLKMIGIWPGKMNTDVFVLNPETYGKYAPPEEYKEIDSAEDVTIRIDLAGETVCVEYVPGPHEKDRTLIVSRNKDLINYLKNAQKSYKVASE